MRKVFMLMTTVFCLGATGCLWADDLNPQPLPPGATQLRKAGGDGGIIVVHPEDNSANTERKAGETQGRKAGGDNLTLNDQAQINGNLNGGSGAGKITGKSLHKSAYFLKYNKNTNSYDKWTKFNGKTVPFTGGTKIQNGYDKQLMPGGGAGNGFVKSNSLSKTGLSGNNQLPAVQK